MLDTKDLQLARFILRLGVGINLFIHGYVRIGHNFSNFQQWILKIFADSGLPIPMLKATTYLIPGVELFCGALIFLGLFERKALLFASSLMLMLIFGSCLIQNWEMVSIQMNYLLVYTILISTFKLSIYSIKGKKI